MMRRFALVSLFLSLGLLGGPVWSQAPDDNVFCELDLVKDVVNIQKSSAIEVVEVPQNHMAVVRIGFDPRNSEIRRAVIEVYYGGKPEGWTVNIADSQSCNGYSGDGATQTNDSEAQMVNDEFTVFGSDLMPPSPETGKVLASVKGFAGEEGVLTFEISNGKITWKNDRGKEGAVESPYIFALNGQPDEEGPVNYDIFVGFNRVVQGIGRSGKGVVKAKIRLFYQ